MTGRHAAPEPVVNESIEHILEAVAVHWAARVAEGEGFDLGWLRDLLLARDNEVLDGIRLLGAGVGLQPSMLELTIMPLGLGLPLDPERIQLLMAQAEAEQQELLHRAWHLQHPGEDCGMGDSP